MIVVMVALFIVIVMVVFVILMASPNRSINVSFAVAWISTLYLEDKSEGRQF